MNSLISVIIPVYNTEKYLRRCLDSVINQTYKNLEIILVDDGSIDNSGKICDEYALKDNRIIVIHKQNSGVSSARNEGLKIAKGDYIGFVDSDDYIELDMYEYLYNLIIKNKVDISCCNRFNFNNGNVSKNLDFPKENNLSFNDILNNQKWGFTIWTKLFKKSVIEKILFNENIVLGEDLLFCFEVLKNTKQIFFSNQCKYYYCENTNSITRTKMFKEKHFFNINFVYDEIISYSKLHNLNLSFKNFTARKIEYYITFMSWILKEDNIEQYKQNINVLCKHIKKYMFEILFSNYKLSKKLFVIVCCINFNLANKIYKFLNKIKIVKG